MDVSSANTNQTSLVEDGLSGASKYTVAQTEPTVKPDPVEPTGLPMKRREEIQDALTADLNGGRTLGDNEKTADTGVQDRNSRESDDTHQIYNWNIKKSALAGGGPAQSPIPSGGSSADFISSIQQPEPTVKADSVEPTGLPMKRREEIQDALTAGLNGGRTLGDNEARTGLPLPTEVESQLQALEALTTPMEDGDDVANTIRKYMGEEAALYWLEHKNDDAEGAEDGDLFSRPTPDNSGAVADEAGDVVGTRATEKLGVRIEGGIADMSDVQAARQAQWGLDVAQRTSR